MASATTASWRAEISPYQWSVLVATTLGWALDGFDFSLFTQVAGPASADLLGHPSPFASGLAVTLFLTGWAVGAIIFGALADYAGRVRVLMIGVLTYSVFTALSSLAPNYPLFVVLRFIAGIGSGVELPIGAALMAEAWTNRYRAKAISIMMSGLAFGSLIAAFVYGVVGGWGWRATLAFGLLPALLVMFIRSRVHEPESTARVQAARRERRDRLAEGAARTTTDRFVLVQLFSRPLTTRTVAGTLICIGALFGFWGLTTWTPAVVRNIVAAHGVSAADSVRYVSWAVAALNIGGIVGYVSWGFIADRIGRKPTYLIGMVCGLAGVLALFPFAHTYTPFLFLLPVCGFGVFGVFSGNSVYLPELFGPSVRASAIAVTNSIGRLFTAAGPLVAGAIALAWFGGNLGAATTVVCALLVVSFLGLALVPETRGRFIYPPEPGGEATDAADEPTGKGLPQP
jgi:MFS family permease